LRLLRRREFITLLGGVAVARPVVARAQQGARMRRIGVFMPRVADDQEYEVRIAAFLQGLGELGWMVGRNLRIDYRWGAGDKPDACLIPQRPQEQAELVVGRDHDWAKARDEAIVFASSVYDCVPVALATLSTSSTRRVRPVCTENLIRIDLVTESLKRRPQ